MAMAAAISSGAQSNDAANRLAHDIFRQLIEINTTDSVGNVTTAAEAMAKRLGDAGYPESDVQVIGPNDRKKNLVARLHGTGAHKPILLICHLDVVEARREDWSMNPFQFIEKDGYFYGRGTQDIKDGDAILMTAMIRMKQEGYKPDRDIILALTADEEGGDFNGVSVAPQEPSGADRRRFCSQSRRWQFRNREWKEISRRDSSHRKDLPGF